MPDTTNYNVSALFKPSDNDYAIKLLRQIFGSIMDSLSGVNATQGGYAQVTTITTVIAAFNLLVLFCAVVVVSYTIYASILNTSKDGQWGGRTMDMRWTSLRSLIAWFGLLPLPSGFTVVQVIVLQFLIWGSSAADYANNKVNTLLVNNSASYIATSDTKADWVETGKVAKVMNNMVRDHLCALYINRITKDLQTKGKPLQETTNHRSAGLWDNNQLIITDSAIEWGFHNSDKSQKKISSTCGSITAYYKAPSQKLLNGAMTDNTGTYEEHLSTLANQVAQKGVEQLFQSLTKSASTVANEIFKGERDTEKLKTEINNDIQTAASIYVSGTSINAGEASSLGQSLLKSASDDGWVFAAQWQRVLSFYSMEIKDARGSVQFSIDDDVSPKAAGSLKARYFGWLGFGSSEEKAIFSEIDETYDYLKNFDSLYKSAGEPIRNTDGITSLEKMSTANQQASGIAPIQWLYNYLLNDMSTQTNGGWADPMISIQEEGQWFMKSGVEVMGASYISPWAAAALIGATLGPEASVSGYFGGKYIGAILSALGKVLIGMGFVALVIVPFLPFIYFLSGVFAWLVMSVEALVAASLWLLLALTPSRSDSLVGDNRQGLMLLIGVIMRPILMIVGLYFCYVLLFVGMSLLKKMMIGAYLIMAPGSTIFDAIMAVGLLGIYIILVFIIAVFSCSLITGLGDFVMQWIGVNVSALGKNAIADNLTSVVNPTQLAGNHFLGMPNHMKNSISNANTEANNIKNARGANLGRSIRFRSTGKK